MCEASRTTRERMTDRLRAEALSPSALASEFELATGAVLSHVRHIARSVEGRGEQLLVAPPECVECGFSDFDDLVNCPSRCPECKNESIEEPIFRVD